MKKQIKRLSPHQNGKVFGILTAVATLPIFLPMFLFMSALMPEVDQNGNAVEFPGFMFIMFPIFYLIFGYISVAVSCFFYNIIQKYIGGFEYEASDIESIENT